MQLAEITTRAVTLKDGRMVNVLALSRDGDEDGHWVTIDGEHVHIKNGKIDKGPPALMGKSKSDLSHKITAEHGEKHPVTGTKAGPTEPTAKVGDHVTLPEYKGTGVNYGKVKDAEVIHVTPKFAVVRQKNDAFMAKMFGEHTDTKIPHEHIAQHGTIAAKDESQAKPAPKAEPAQTGVDAKIAKQYDPKATPELPGMTAGVKAAATSVVKPELIEHIRTKHIPELQRKLDAKMAQHAKAMGDLRDNQNASQAIEKIGFSPLDVLDREKKANGLRKQIESIDGELQQAKMAVRKWDAAHASDTPTTGADLTPTNLISTAKRIKDGEGSGSVRPLEFSVNPNGIVHVAHSVTARDYGTIDLKTGHLVPTATGDEEKLAKVQKHIADNAMRFSLKSELENLKDYPTKNAEQIKKLEKQLALSARSLTLPSGRAVPLALNADTLASLAQCPSCNSYNVQRKPSLIGGRSIDRCKDCGHLWVHKSGTLTAEQHSGGAKACA